MKSALIDALEAFEQLFGILSRLKMECRDPVSFEPVEKDFTIGLELDSLSHEPLEKYPLSEGIGFFVDPEL